jgi:hypothetical protein
MPIGEEGFEPPGKVDKFEIYINMNILYNAQIVFSFIETLSASEGFVP